MGTKAQSINATLKLAEESFASIEALLTQNRKLIKERNRRDQEMLERYKVPAGEPNSPFTIYQKNLADTKPQEVDWLWQNRIPLSGLTLLDGDHGCGKSLLALQIAASVSSGTPMPDGTKPIRGGVVIISPNTDATTTQLQLLTALGADLSRIEILSYIQEELRSDPPLSHYRPFSYPEDFIPLCQAINRVQAGLIIIDPFISILPQKTRMTDQKLSTILSDLNQQLIYSNIACLITRNCHARGGNARPTILERSDHFSTIAVSRLLLSPDPMQPDHLLLSHALNRHAALTPTLTIQIQSIPEKPHLPYITILGTHSLRAKALIENRPDTLHRELLTQHLLRIIAATTDPIHVSTLYAKSPHSSAFQIQRSLADLLNMGQIEHPARGFYTHVSTTPIFPPNETSTTIPMPEPVTQLNSVTATTPMPEPETQLDSVAATTPISEPETQLDSVTATTPISEPVTQLNSVTATTPTIPPTSQLDITIPNTPGYRPPTCGCAWHTWGCQCNHD